MGRSSPAARGQFHRFDRIISVRDFKYLVSYSVSLAELAFDVLYTAAWFLVSLSMYVSFRLLALLLAMKYISPPARLF